MGPFNPSLLLLALSLITLPIATNAFWSVSKAETSHETETITHSNGKTTTTTTAQHDNNHDHLPTGIVRAEYGVDVSFPMHYGTVSQNYPWLAHNVDPSVRTPRELKGVPIQPLGDRQKFYDDFLQSCVDAFKPRSERCRINEQDRIAMSLRQPQSMQVRSSVHNDNTKKNDMTFTFSSCGQICLELYRHWIQENQSSTRAF
jgi:hypothetical protein